MKKIKITIAYLSASVIVFICCIGCQSSFQIRHIEAQVMPDKKIRILFESDRDLVELRKTRLVQLRCSVVQSVLPNSPVLTNFGMIFYHGQNIREIDKKTYIPVKTPVLYSALIDSGRFYDDNTRIDLNILEKGFLELRYYVIGVTKAPVVFPKSNEIIVRSDEMKR
jgi:hypothetical protein